MLSLLLLLMSSFFFFNDTATTEIYTLSLHDALPISRQAPAQRFMGHLMFSGVFDRHPKLKVTCAEYDVGWVAHIYQHRSPDRKSTRLNSSHGYISYAVFCLKKKKTVIQRPTA